MTHNFTDRKPWVATEEDCKAPWNGRRDGTNFKCRFCGHKFAPGDVVRWEFTNDTKGAGGNPLICVGCDGTREEIIAKVIDLNKGSDVLRVERDALRAEVERLKKWQREMVEKAAAKSLDGYRELGAKCAALEEERDGFKMRLEGVFCVLRMFAREKEELTVKVEKYHQIMEALKRSKLEHGRCDSPGHKACTRCMAEEKIAQLIAEYNGRNIVIASMGLPDERTLTREQVQEHLRDAGIDMEKAQAKLKAVLKKQEDKP